MTRYVIVCSGAAGISAAEAIRERDAAGEIVLVSEEPHAPYSRPGLAYVLARTLPEWQLPIRTQAELADLALTRVTARIDRVDPEGHRVINDVGREHSYDRLLVATGSRSMKPTFDGAGLDGVFQIDSLDDARDFRRRARRARTAVVVGGGPTAIGSLLSRVHLALLPRRRILGRRLVISHPHGATAALATRTRGRAPPIEPRITGTRT